MTSSRSGRRSVAIFIVVCVAVWLVPTGIAVGLWSASALVERAAVTADDAEIIQVGERVDAEARDAVVDVYLGDAHLVSSESTGTVTQVLTSPGSALTNGVPVIAIGDAVIRAFAQDFPLYRPLVRGDRGPDVEALEMFLRDGGFLDVATIDDVYGVQVDRAVRAFQKDNGYTVDGVFDPSYVAYVGTAFTVAAIDVVPGDKVAVDDQIMSGTAPATKVEIKDPDLNPLPPFSGAPLMLLLADSSVSVDGTSLDGAAAMEVATALATSGAGGTTVEDGAVVRYANARIELSEPGAWGTVPSSAVYISDTGVRCAVDENGTAIPLVDSRESTGQPGIMLVQADLVGMRVLSDVAQAPSGSLDACE